MGKIKSTLEHPVTILGPIAKPFPTPDKGRKWYTSDNSEECLANVYAISHVIASVSYLPD